MKNSFALNSARRAGETIVRLVSVLLLAVAMAFGQDTGQSGLEASDSQRVQEGMRSYIGLELGVAPDDLSECNDDAACRFRRIFGIDDWREILLTRRVDLLVDEARGDFCHAGRRADMKVLLDSDPAVVAEELDALVDAYLSLTRDSTTNTSRVLDDWTTSKVIDDQPAVPDLLSNIRATEKANGGDFVVREETVRVFDAELAAAAFDRRRILVDNFRTMDAALVEARDDIILFFLDTDNMFQDQAITELDEKFVGAIGELNGRIDLFHQEVQAEFENVRRSISEINRTVNFLLDEREEEGEFGIWDVLEIESSVLGAIPVVGGVAAAIVDIGVVTAGAVLFEDRARLSGLSGNGQIDAGEPVEIDLSGPPTSTIGLRNEITLQIQWSRSLFREARQFILSHPTVLRRMELERKDVEAVRAHVMKTYWSLLAGLLFKIERGTEEDTLKFGAAAVNFELTQMVPGADLGVLADGKMYSAVDGVIKSLDPAPASFADHAVALRFPSGGFALYGMHEGAPIRGTAFTAPNTLITYDNGEFRNTERPITGYMAAVLHNDTTMSRDHHLFLVEDNNGLTVRSERNGRVRFFEIRNGPSFGHDKDIAAVSWRDDFYGVVGVGNDDHLYEVSTEKSDWDDEDDWDIRELDAVNGTGPGGGFAGAIAAIKVSADRTDVFGVANNGNLLNFHYGRIGGLEPGWTDLGRQGLVGTLRVSRSGDEIGIIGLTSRGVPTRVSFDTSSNRVTSTQTLSATREVNFGVRYQNGDWLPENVLSRLIDNVSWKSVYQILANEGAAFSEVTSFDEVLTSFGTNSWVAADLPSAFASIEAVAVHRFENTLGGTYTGYSNGVWVNDANEAEYTQHDVPGSDYFYLLGEGEIRRIPIRGGDTQIWSEAFDRWTDSFSYRNTSLEESTFVHSDDADVSFELVKVGGLPNAEARNQSWRQVIGSTIYDLDSSGNGAAPELANATLTEVFRVTENVAEVRDGEGWTRWDRDQCDGDVVASGNHWRVDYAQVLAESYAPGEEVELDIDFWVRNPPSCPGCRTQFVVGYGDTAVECLVNQTIREPIEDSRIVRFTAPTQPGEYTISVGYELQNSCEDAGARFSLENRRHAITTFTVGGAGASFRRGDVDNDGQLNLTDAINTLNYLFQGGSDPSCLKAADFDDSGTVNITDPINTLNFLFLGGSAPVAPGLICGVDPTDDNLSCEAACAE